MIKVDFCFNFVELLLSSSIYLKILKVMMKQILVVAIFMLGSVAVYSQTTFQRTYKNATDDWLGSLVEASNGDFLTVGFTASGPAGNDDGYIMRTDQYGVKLWAITSGDSSLNHFISIIEDGTTDNFYIVGRTEGQGLNNGDGLFGKIDGNGNILWLKAYGGDGDESLRKIVPAGNGDYFLCGYASSSFGAGSFDNYVLRVDNTGNVVWSKTFGGIDNDKARSMAMDQNGDLIVVGYVQSFGAGQKDISVTKLDTAAGNIIWSYAYGHPKTEKAQELVTDTNGNIIIAGESKMDFGSGLVFNVALMHLDSLGTVNWSKLYTDTFDTKSWSITNGINGGYVLGSQGNVVGAVNDTTTESSVIKVDAAGALEWAVALGGNGKEMRPEIISTTDNAYLTGISSSSFANDTLRDPYLVKMDTIGVSGCNSVTKSFTTIDTSFIKTTLSWTDGTGGTANTLNWSAVSNSFFMQDTLCQNIIGLSIDEGATNARVLSISPNPSTGVYQLNGVSKKNSVLVYNQLGKLVFQSNNTTRIDLRNYVNGIYFISVRTADGNMYSVKAILEGNN
jgi:type IX secretion system substrate protein